MISAEIVQEMHVMYMPTHSCRRYVLSLLWEYICVGDMIRATGVTPNASLLASMGLVRGELEAIKLELHRMQQTLVPKFTEAMSQLLEEKSVHAGVITDSSLEQRLKRLLDDFKSTVREEFGTDRAAQSSVQQPSTSESRKLYNAYTWGGRFHPVPDSFSIPTVPLLNAWRLYCCGNGDLDYPPYRCLIPANICNEAHRKIFNNYSCTMQTIERHVIGLPAQKDQPTSIEEATAMFEEALPHLDLSLCSYQ